MINKASSGCSEPNLGFGLLPWFLWSLPCFPSALWAQSELEKELALDYEQGWLNVETSTFLEATQTETWLSRERLGFSGSQNNGLKAWKRDLDTLPWPSSHKIKALERLQEINALPNNPWFWLSLPWMDSQKAHAWARIFNQHVWFGNQEQILQKGITVDGMWGLNLMAQESSLLQYRIQHIHQNLRWALGWDNRKTPTNSLSVGGHIQGQWGGIRWILGDFHLESANFLFFQTLRVANFAQPWSLATGREWTRPAIRWATGTPVRGISLQTTKPWGRLLWSVYQVNSGDRVPWFQNLSYEHRKGRWEYGVQGGLLTNQGRIGGHGAFNGKNFRWHGNLLWIPANRYQNGSLGQCWSLLLTPHPRWSLGLRYRLSEPIQDPVRALSIPKTTPQMDTQRILNALWQLRPYWNLAFRVQNQEFGMDLTATKGPLRSFRWFMIYQNTQNNKHVLRQYLRIPWKSGPHLQGDVQFTTAQSWHGIQPNNNCVILAYNTLWQLQNKSDIRIRVGQTWVISGPEGEALMVREEHRFGTAWWRGSQAQLRFHASIQGRSKGTGWRFWLRRVVDSESVRWECSLRLTQRWTDESYH